MFFCCTDDLLWQTLLTSSPRIFALRGLRNLPVLAKWTAEIAPNSSNRKGCGARQKMIEGFFLYWIHMSCNDIPVNLCVEFPSSVLSDSTDTKLHRHDLAVMMTEETGDFLPTGCAIKHGLFFHVYTLSLLVLLASVKS